MDQRAACGQAILRYSVETQPSDIVRAGRVRVHPEKPNPMHEGFISCFLLENARPNHAFGVISGGFKQLSAAASKGVPRPILRPESTPKSEAERLFAIPSRLTFLVIRPPSIYTSEPEVNRWYEAVFGNVLFIRVLLWLSQLLVEVIRIESNTRKVPMPGSGSPVRGGFALRRTTAPNDNPSRHEWRRRMHMDRKPQGLR